MDTGRNPVRFESSGWAGNALRVFLVVAVLSTTFVVLPQGRADAAPIPESSTTDTFDPGAYIIDMGVEPQTIENTLRAYGLVYSLMIEHLIPVEWIISDSKTGDGLGPSTDADLVYDGQEFKGGPFVIRAEYAELAKPILDQWGGPAGTVLADGESGAGSAGLTIVGPTTEPLDIPVFKTLTNWPNAVLDQANGKFGQGYFQDAGIPQVTTSAATGQDKIAYVYKDPQDLDACDDIYILPHADPGWDTHSNLVPWNDQGGYIWAGCHAVSVLENATDPSDPNPDPDMNFLSTEGLIDFGDHDDGTPPYEYSLDVSDPIMQFIGRTDDAHQNGSEQIYLPADGSAWNPGANILVYDGDHPDLDVSPGEAAALVYGRGFDDPTNGLVMYEGGHSIDTGTEHGVAAIRAYMNLHLLAGIERGIAVDADIPETILAGSTVDVSATVEGGDPDYQYQWVSTCGGTFSPASGVAGSGELIASTFTAPEGATDCQLSIEINDFCGRGGFEKVPVQVVEEADLSIEKTDDQLSVAPGDQLTYTLTVTNNGPNDATEVVVTDTWPGSQLTYLSSSPSQGTCSFSSGQVVCDLGSLAVGASATIELTGQVRADATGEILNTASVDATQVDPTPGDNTATDATLVSGLRLEKTADPMVIDVLGSGGPVDVTYTFEVSNVGPGDLSNVVVTDTDVPGCTPGYVSGDENTDDVLQVGEVWVFTCVVPIGEDFVNTATVTAETEDGDPVEATDSAEVDAITPGIEITKGPDDQTVTEGGSLVFDVTVTNTGDVDLVDVTVADPAAPGCDRYLGSLAVGASITYSCALSPAPAAPSSGTNTIEVEGQIPGGGSVTDTDDAGYTVVGADLEIVKEPVDCATGDVLVDPAYYPGDQVCYRVVVTNTGSETQTNVELSDDLPAGIDHVETEVTAPVTLIDDNFDRDVTGDIAYDAGWTEFQDNGQAKDGDVEIRSDGSCPQPDQCLYVKNDDKGLQWETDLSTTTTVDISYQYTIRRNNDPGRFFVGCWDGGSWVELDVVTYPNNGTLPPPAGPTSVDLAGTALPASCQLAAGRIGLIVSADPGDGTNSDNEVLFDTVSITTAADSISDDFENYLATAYYSTGIVPGWAEYKDNVPAERDNRDVRAAEEADPSQDCVTPGECAVAIRKRDRGLVWPADYSTFGECALSFDYRIYRIDKGEGVIRIGGADVATNTWIATHDTIAMSGTTGWLSYSTTISAADLPGLFIATGGLGVSHGTVGSDNDRFAVDNVSIACVDTFITTDHPVIVDASDEIDLVPGAQLVAEITATVTGDGGPWPRELVNVASTTSDQQTAPSTDAASVERVIPGIALEKTVDPELTDPDTPVTYTFTVTNTGNEPLENVTITDTEVPDCTPVLESGDTDADDVLAVDETWVFTCTVAVAESFTNTATAGGDPTTPGTGEAVVVEDTDVAEVDVVDAGIVVVKSASETLVRPGAPVVYTYDVTVAPGTDEPLAGVSVVDDMCAPVTYVSGDTNDDELLQPGETWTFRCSANLDETTTNVAEASGTDRSGTIQTAADEATVTVIDPAIELVKTASPTEVGPGGTVTYTFEVSNPGNDPLTDIELVDNLCAPLVLQSGDDGDGVLAPGETWFYTCTTTVSEDTTNIAEVSGNDSLGKPWTAGDTAEVNVVVPSIAVGKEADASLVFPGDVVTYRIVVYNDGDFAFDTVTLADDTCSPLVYESGDTNDNDLLEPGEGWFYTCTTTLDETTTNTVEVEVTGPDGSASGTDSDRVRVHDPLLEITKEASETLVPAGTEVTYTYTVTNVSVCGALDLNCRQDNEIIDPVVTDDKCSPVTYVSGDVGDVGRMVIGETWTFECTAVITETTTNVAEATGDDVNGITIPRDPPTATETVEISFPELAIAKPAPELTADADGSGDLSAGDTLTYTVTLANTGTAPLTGVTIEDSLYGPDPYACPDLAPGATCVLTYDYVVTAEDVAAGEIVNTATGDADQTGPVIDTVTTPTPVPLLDVDKADPVNLDEDGSGDVSVGDTLRFTVTLTNLGSAVLTGVTISDPLYPDSPFACPDLAPRETCEVTYDYTVTADDVAPEADGTPGSIVNTATGDADQTGPVIDVVVTPTPTPILTIDKRPPTFADPDGDADASGDVSEGDILVYTVIVTNDGEANLTGVTIDDPLYGPDPYVCPQDPLLPGDQCILTYSYEVTADDVAAGVVRNTATGDSDQTPEDIDNETVVVPRPRMAIQKTAPVFADPDGDADGSGDISAGDVLTYTVTVNNIGTATLTGVEISDPLYPGSPYVCPDLAPGQACELTYDHTVTTADVAEGFIINPATAVSDQTDAVTDTEITPVPRPRLTTEKAAPSFAADDAGRVYGDEDGSGDVSAGDVLAYTVTVTNTGTATLTDVTVTDPKLTPGTVTCPLVTPEASCVLKGVYTVTDADVEAGSILNTATGTSDQTGTDTDSEVTPVRRPELSIEKEPPVFADPDGDADGSGDVSAGDTLTYTITVTNTGDANLTGVTISDPLYGPDPYVCPDLAPKATCVLTYDHVVTQADVDAGEIVNTATGDSDQTDEVTDQVVTPVPQPSVSIVKDSAFADPDGDADGSGDVSVGDTRTYTITVTNTGDANLTGVTIDDPLYGPDPYVCPDLAPKATCVLTYDYVVTASDVEAGAIVNTATVETDQTDPGLGLEITPVPTPALAVDKLPPVFADADGDADGSGDVSAGDTLTYTITVTNTGDANLTGVTIDDPLYGPDPYVCPDLAPKATCVLTYDHVVTQADVDAGQIVNTATGDSDQTDGITDQVVTPVPQPELTLVKDEPSFADPDGDADGSGDVSEGDTLTYRVTVTNTGSATLTGVTIDDPLYGPDPYVCPDLAPGARCVLTYDHVVTAQDVTDGSIVNTATGDTDQTDPVIDTVVTPTPFPLMALDKGDPVNLDEDGSGDVSAGDTLRFTVTLTNTGSANLTGVTISDPLYPGSPFACPDLAPTQKCTLTYDYTVTAADVAPEADGTPGTIVNTATGDTDQTGPVIDTVVTPTPTPILTIDKLPPVFADPDGDADGSGDVSVGDILTYTVVVTNEGEANLTGVTIEDPLYGPDPYVCPDLAAGERCMLTYDHTVTADDVAAGVIRNTATGDSDQTPEDIDNEDVVVPRPRMSIEKDAPVFADPDGDADGSGDVSVGDTLTYTVVVTNTGTANLTGVEISDPLYVDSPFVCPDLAPGATCRLVYDHTVTTDDLAARAIINPATGVSDQTDPVTDTEVTPVPRPALRIDKSEPVFADPDGDADGSGDISLGDTLTYTVVVTNTGTANLTGVEISDPLYVDSPFGCPDLAPGATCRLVYDYTVTVEDLNDRVIINPASAVSDQTPGAVIDTVVTPVPRPGLTIDKSDPVFADPGGDADGSGDVSVGDTLTYTVTLTNSGTATLTGVTIEDPLYGPDPYVCPDLAPGARCVLSYDHVVTVEDVAAGEIVNTATGGSDQTGDRTDEVVEQLPAPQLAIVKSDPVFADPGGDADGSGDVSVGDTLTYTVTLTNVGSANLTGVTINDPLYGLAPFVCPDLAPRDTCVLSYDYEVTTDDLEAKQIVNTAFGDSDQTGGITDQVVTPVPQPDLTVTKDKAFADPDGDADGSGDVSVGDTLTYTVTVTNIGTATLTGVTIEDPLYAGGTYACPDLAPGETCVLAYDHLVTAADVAAGVILNVATVDTDQTDPDVGLEITPVPRPALSLVKGEPVLTDADGSGGVSEGDTLTYTVTLTNTGRATLTGVTIDDPLYGPDPYVCPDLAPGDFCRLTYDHVVTAQDVTAGEIVNVAVGDADQTEEVTDQVVTPVPRLFVFKDTPVFADPDGDADGSGDISAGDVLTYTITVFNTGTTVLTGVTISDPLFPGSPYACPDLDPGDTCVLSYDYEVTADDVSTGQIFNEATGDSDQTAPETGEITTPLPFPQLRLVKDAPVFADPDGDADGSGDVSVGDVLTYTVTVTNIGTATLTGVTVSDPLLPGSPVSCPDLAPTATCVLEYDHTVTQDDVDAGDIVNTATADSDQTGPTSTTEVTPVPRPRLDIDKPAPTFTDAGDRDGSGDVSAGDVLLYTITATNTGTANLVDVVVTDDLIRPSTTTCGLLVPGDTCVLRGVYVVTADDVDRGEIENTATAVTGPDGALEVTDKETVIVPRPAVTIDKSAPAFAADDEGVVYGDVDGSGDISAGDVLAYTVTATNTGTATLTDVTVTDLLLTPNSTTCALVEPGGTCVLKGTYEVTPADVAAGTIINIGEVGSTQTGDRSGTDSEITVVPRPALTVEKTGPINADEDGSGDVSVGDTLTYKVIVTNTGNANLTDVVVSDPLLDTDSVTCELLAPTLSCVLVGTYVVTESDVDAGVIVNTATGGSDQTESGTDEIETPVPTPALEVVKTGPINADEDGSGDVTVGDTLTYTVTATNTGTAFLTNVVLSDPLLDPDTKTCPLLAPGATCILTGTYVVTPEDVIAGTIVNDATADSDQTDPGGDRITIDVPPAAMVLEKSAPELTDDADASEDVSAGDTLTYSIVATNTGEANLTDVVITDDLITVTGGTAPCALLAPGETCTLEGTYVVTAADVDAGSLTNVATAQSDSTDRITDEVTVALPQPALQLEKPPPTLTGDVDGSGDITVGDTVTFTITATNIGTANLVGVVITDEMITPASVDCPMLRPGDTCVLEGTYQVTVADAEAGFIANQASAGNGLTEVLDEVLVNVGEIPATGAETWPIVRLSLALLALGGTLLLLGRRRQELSR